MKTKILIAALAALSGGAFWFFEAASYATFFGFLHGYALLDLVLFLSFLSLVFIFLEPRMASLVVLLSTLPIMFLLESKSLALGIIVFLSAFSIIPASNIRSEALERVSFSIWSVLRKGLPTFLTFLALSLAVFFYPSGNITEFEDIIPRPLFEAAILPFGDLGGNGEVKGALYESSIDLLEERFGSYEHYLPAVFALAVFAALRTLFIFIGLAAIALAWVMIRILLYANILSLSRKEASQEYLEIK